MAAVAVLCAILSQSICAAQSAVPGDPAQTAAHTPAQSGLSPDIQVLLVQASNGQEMVDLTYPAVVPEDQARRDVAAIGQATKLPIIGMTPTKAHPDGDIDISNEALPLAGVKPIPMTSVTFATVGALPVGQSTFLLEPWIVALRGYSHVAVTYMMPPDFVFNGLRTYHSRNVDILLDRRASTYTYRVRVLDSHFDRLNLPLVQPDATAVKYAELQEQRTNRIKLIGIVLAGVLAAAVGYAVYAVLSRLP